MRCSHVAYWDEAQVQYGNTIVALLMSSDSMEMIMMLGTCGTCEIARARHGCVCSKSGIDGRNCSTCQRTHDCERKSLEARYISSKSGKFCHNFWKAISGMFQQLLSMNEAILKTCLFHQECQSFPLHHTSLTSPLQHQSFEL